VTLLWVKDFPKSVPRVTLGVVNISVTARTGKAIEKLIKPIEKALRRIFIET
jgi:phenolic acid decarboxylase